MRGRSGPTQRYVFQEFPINILLTILNSGSVWYVLQCRQYQIAWEINLYQVYVVQTHISMRSLSFLGSKIQVVDLGKPGRVHGQISSKLRCGSSLRAVD